MAYQSHYSPETLDRAAVDAHPGARVLEFGTNWCGHCHAAQPLIQAALAEYPDMEHIKVEDGKGRPLGRSYRVRLWPTLIFLRDGEEVARLVRPRDDAEIREALARITA